MIRWRLVPRDGVGALAATRRCESRRSSTVMVIRSRQSRARPKQSKPGPRLALVAGTSTVTVGRAAESSPSVVSPHTDATAVRSAATTSAWTGPRPDERGFDVLQTVAGDRDHDLLPGFDLAALVLGQQSGHTRPPRPARRRCPPGRPGSLRGEDLLVGDGFDQPAATRRGRRSPGAPRRDCRSGSRWPPFRDRAPGGRAPAARHRRPGNPTSAVSASPCRPTRTGCNHASRPRYSRRCRPACTCRSGASPRSSTTSNAAVF